MKAAEGPARHNLPCEMSSFVGREQQLADLVGLLGRARLLTLVGTGGVGKTRLALRLASTVLDHYPDGVWLVELTPFSDPSLLPRAVAVVLGVHERARRPLLEAVAAVLRGKRLLLVLDNCEHLVAGAADLADQLLRACPELVVLATSREPLRAPGETIWRVPSLNFPNGAEAAASVEELSGHEAVRLFVERATAVRSEFSLGERNASLVADICRRLDGIPLALELAAARVAVLGTAGVAARLDDRFRLLTGGSRGAPPRQQTLQAALEWSYDLLSQPERRLFNRLSVFAGGWTLEAAETVCAGDGVEASEVLDLVARQVNKSLVVADPAAEETVRYRLLETLRQYAQERLTESGEVGRTRSRHAAFYLDLAERTEPECYGPGFVQWRTRLDLEMGNIRGAWRWLIDSGEAVAAQRMGGALMRFLQTGGYLSEGRSWMTELLDMPGGTARTLARARVLTAMGSTAGYQGDYVAARPALEEAVELCRELRDSDALGFALYYFGQLLWWSGDFAGAHAAMLENLALTRQAGLGPQQALSLYVLGGLAYDCGDYAAALAWAEECLALWVGQQYPRGIAVALQTLARVHYQMGDLAKAQNLLEEGMPLFRETSWPWGIAWNLSTLGWVATDQGDLARARAHFAESLAIWRELGVPVRMIEVLEGFAQLAQAEARPGVAMRLAGLTTAQREALGSRLSPTEERRLQPRLERARQALTPAVAETAWAAGRDISLDDAVAEVLDVATNARLTPVADDHRAPLTAREREVAVLIARGLTNRGVAEALVITQRTAERHVENILGKLGLHTRAQIAVWAVQHDLVPAAARQDG